jgi:hypothetical protein
VFTGGAAERAECCRVGVAQKDVMPAAGKDRDPSGFLAAFLQRDWCLPAHEHSGSTAHGGEVEGFEDVVVGECLVHAAAPKGCSHHGFCAFSSASFVASNSRINDASDEQKMVAPSYLPPSTDITYLSLIWVATTL